MTVSTLFPNSQFIPATGLSNLHLQTLLPRVLFSGSQGSFIEKRIELSDGDFIDLSMTSLTVKQQPIVLVFHGLEGSIHSPYASRVMQAIHAKGWCGVLMHFRGCSGTVNRLARTYHSGETGDAKYIVAYLQSQYPGSSISAIGFSLGGNMLLKLQGEWGADSPLKAAASVCAPIKLADSADTINKGFAKYYQAHLLGSLKTKIKNKYHQHQYGKHLGIALNDIDKIRSFWEFDDYITAPLHGFADVNDYYDRCSSFSFLNNIRVPTLILHAMDDPFMSHDVIPSAEDMSSSITLELSQYGGHVGFIAGSIRQPQFWLGKRLTDYLQNFLR